MVLLIGISVLISKRATKPDLGRRHSLAGAALGDEATSLLAAALKKTGVPADGLSRTLADIKNFKGLTDTFEMDRYGDTIRPFYLGTIRDGNYVDIDALIPTEPRD